MFGTDFAIKFKEVGMNMIKVFFKINLILILFIIENWSMGNEVNSAKKCQGIFLLKNSNRSNSKLPDISVIDKDDTIISTIVELIHKSYQKLNIEFNKSQQLESMLSELGDIKKSDKNENQFIFKKSISAGERRDPFTFKGEFTISNESVSFLFEIQANPELTNFLSILVKDINFYNKIFSNKNIPSIKFNKNKNDRNNTTKSNLNKFDNFVFQLRDNALQFRSNSNKNISPQELITIFELYLGIINNIKNGSFNLEYANQSVFIQKKFDENILYTEKETIAINYFLESIYFNIKYFMIQYMNFNSQGKTWVKVSDNTFKKSVFNEEPSSLEGNFLIGIQTSELKHTSRNGFDAGTSVKFEIISGIVKKDSVETKKNGQGLLDINVTLINKDIFTGKVTERTIRLNSLEPIYVLPLYK